MRSTVEGMRGERTGSRVAPPPHAQGTKLALRGSMYNPVMVGGEAICRTGRCARVCCVSSALAFTHPSFPQSSDLRTVES